MGHRGLSAGGVPSRGTLPALPAARTLRCPMRSPRSSASHFTRSTGWAVFRADRLGGSRSVGREPLGASLVVSVTCTLLSVVAGPLSLALLTPVIPTSGMTLTIPPSHMGGFSRIVVGILIVILITGIAHVAQVGHLKQLGWLA